MLRFPVRDLVSTQNPLLRKETLTLKKFKIRFLIVTKHTSVKMNRSR